MNYSSFETLPNIKKDIILKVCIEEFAEYGFENASTNRMVKNIGMSKGSLFKYFNTKEELYIYIIDYAVSSITKSVTENTNKLPIDFFERLYMLAEMEFDIYVEKPLYYRLLKGAFSVKSHISQKLVKKYALQSNGFFDYIFRKAEINNTKYPMDHIINLIKWVLEGYNDVCMNSNLNKEVHVDKLKSDYLSGIQMYITMIRNGIDK